MASPQDLPRRGVIMMSRWAAAPAPGRIRGHEGNHGLHSRWETYLARKKKPVVANVTIARELAGWCWSLATMPD